MPLPPRRRQALVVLDLQPGRSVLRRQRWAWALRDPWAGDLDPEWRRRAGRPRLADGRVTGEEVTGALAAAVTVRAAPAEVFVLPAATDGKSAVIEQVRNAQTPAGQRRIAAARGAGIRVTAGQEQAPAKVVTCSVRLSTAKTRQFDGVDSCYYDEDHRAGAWTRHVRIASRLAGAASAT